jgi:cytochrome d ubiquinol oxidase subunit I
MIVAAWLVTGFSVAAYYAGRLLRRPESLYCRHAMGLGLALAIPLVPVQILLGDWSAKVVARSQPVKFAAMEGHFRTQAWAPLHVGGIPDEALGETRYSLPIPGGLSFLAFSDPAATVRGLEEFPPSDRPPVAVVHFAFQVMVGIGMWMLVVAAWAAVTGIRHRRWPRSRTFLWAVVGLGPLSVAALEAGWMVTEVGRQPWIVQGYMRTAEAVTEAPGVWTVFVVTLGIYLLIGSVTVSILGRLARLPLPEEAGDGLG